VQLDVNSFINRLDLRNPRQTKRNELQDVGIAVHHYHYHYQKAINHNYFPIRDGK